MTALILLKNFYETQIEIWRPIEGFPDYDVSNLGRVRSWKERHAKQRRLKEPRIMKLTLSTGKRLQVTLRRNGAYYTKRVTTLVAMAFLPNPKHLPEVNHKTGLSTDNRVDGLEWVTGQNNQDHARLYALAPCGERSGSAKVTNDDVREIRQLWANGMSQRAIGKIFGLKQPAVGSICRRETWYLID